MPTDISKFGPHHSKPTEEIRQRFAQHLKHSDFPEDFPGVAIGVRPPKDRGFTIIHTDVTVAPTSRQRLSRDPENPLDCYLPCNLCGPSPKFKNSGYAILCDFGWIYFVGNECAMIHYEGRFSDAKRIYDREAADRRAQAYFFENAALLPRVAAHAQELLQIASTYAPAHDAIRRLPSLRKALRFAITAQGGWLQVKRLEQVQLGDGTSFAQEVIENFARITGEPALRAQFDYEALLRANTALLSGFGSNEDEALQAIMAELSSGKLPELHNAVIKSLTAIGLARDGLRQFRQFFQPDNLEKVQRWLRLRDCEVQCRAENNGNIWWFKQHANTKRRPIDISIFQAPIPKPPA